MGIVLREEQNNLFDTEYLKVDLKGRSVRGGAVTMAAQGIRFFFQIGSTAVLARLLTPEDYGLIAMVAVVTGFVMMFKDMGLSMATVQKAQINHGQISTLFWINILISLVIMAVMAALAPVVAWFYSEPQLTLVALTLAGTFIFSGLTIQHQALLRRQMRFGRLAVIEIVAMLNGAVAAIVSAWYGAGYWALVIMQLVTAMSIAVGVWIGCDWRPGWPKRGSNVRSMLAFGGNLTGFSFLNYFTRNMDKLLIGKVYGITQLGLYAKAYQLLLLPLRQITGPISSVAIPTLSRLQNDDDRYRQYYYQAINMIAFITMPLVMVTAALSEEIILIVLGKQWINAGVIFKVLAFSALIQPVGSTIGWVYVSLGQTKRMMHWGMISAPVCILSFIIGLPWGGLGVAISYTLFSIFILFVPSLYLAYKYSPISIAGFFNAILCPLLISIVACIAIETVRHVINISDFRLIFFCSSLAGLLAFILGVLVWPKARNEALGMVKLIRMLKASESQE